MTNFQCNRKILSIYFVLLLVAGLPFPSHFDLWNFGFEFFANCPVPVSHVAKVHYEWKLTELWSFAFHSHQNIFFVDFVGMILNAPSFALTFYDSLSGTISFHYFRRTANEYSVTIAIYILCHFHIAILVYLFIDYIWWTISHSQLSSKFIHFHLHFMDSNIKLILSSEWRQISIYAHGKFNVFISHFAVGLI